MVRSLSQTANLLRLVHLILAYKLFQVQVQVQVRLGVYLVWSVMSTISAILFTVPAVMSKRRRSVARCYCYLDYSHYATEFESDTAFHLVQDAS